MLEANDPLKLENQLCFPLYACSKEIIRRYKPHLDRLDLTYTQYITMMVLWDRTEVNVKELGEALFLDSGTLTPVLKKLEKKGYVTRSRCVSDERSTLITITPEGEALRESAAQVPLQMGECVQLSAAEAGQLYTLLYKVLRGLDAEQAQ